MAPFAIRNGERRLRHSDPRKGLRRPRITSVLLPSSDCHSRKSFFAFSNLSHVPIERGVGSPYPPTSFRTMVSGKATHYQISSSEGWILFEQTMRTLSLTQFHQLAWPPIIGQRLFLDKPHEMHMSAVRANMADARPFYGWKDSLIRPDLSWPAVS